MGIYRQISLPLADGFRRIELNKGFLHRLFRLEDGSVKLRVQRLVWLECGIRMVQLSKVYID